MSVSGLQRYNKYFNRKTFFDIFYCIFVMWKQGVMDIKLFSDIIKELLAGHDKVTLPGFGCFVVEDVPASFSDRGFTINPPYRRVVFRPLGYSVNGSGLNADDLLVEFYAAENKTDKQRARVVVNDFVNYLREKVYSNKVVVLPDFGKLRSTRENNVFFIQDEGLRLFPHLDCLESVSLKSLTAGNAVTGDRSVPSASVGRLDSSVPVPSATVESQVAIGVETLAAPSVPEAIEAPALAIPDAPAIETPVPVAPAAATVTETVAVEQSADPAKSRWWIYALAAIFLLVAIALATIAILGRLRPDLIDPLLYSPEELEIVNYQRMF